MSVAFVGVDVLTMAGQELLRDQTVLIAGDRIAAYGDRAAMTVPARARQIDGGGATLMPGLIDMGMYGLDPHDQLPYLAQGSTTIHHLRGSLLQLDWNAQIAAGEMVGPHIYATSNVIDSSTSGWNGGFSQADAPADVAAILDTQARHGFGYARIGPSLASDVYDAVLAGAAERGLLVSGELPFDVGLAEIGAQTAIYELGTLIAALQPEGFEPAWGPPRRFFANPDAYLTVDSSRLADVAEKISAAGAAVIVAQPMFLLGTLSADDLQALVNDSSPRDPRLPFVRWRLQGMVEQVRGRTRPGAADRAVQALAMRREVLAALHTAGVTLLPATGGFNAERPGHGASTRAWRSSSRLESPPPMLSTRQRPAPHRHSELTM